MLQSRANRSSSRAADIDVLMNGGCFAERAVEELELQGATKVLYTLKMMQKTNCCVLGTSHLH
jgi:hypothetical protein